MDHIENWSNKEEHEFNGLGDTGDEGCQRYGCKEAGVFCPASLRDAVPHGKAGAWETEHHGVETASKEAGALGKESYVVGIRQLGEEDLLRTHHLNTVDQFGATQRGVPEQGVDHVVQSGRAAEPEQ